MCVQNALQSSIRSNERVGCSSDAEAGWHGELRVGKLPEIGSLATDQRQHVTMQCTKREHEIPRAMLCLILLFLLWKTHVVLSIFFQLWQERIRPTPAAACGWPPTPGKDTRAAMCA